MSLHGEMEKVCGKKIMISKSKMTMNIFGPLEIVVAMFTSLIIFSKEHRYFDIYL